MFSAFKIAASTAIFSFSSLFVFDAIAKPQNARSRIYNEFHTDLFAKEPPLRSECPSWKDVVKGDTFDNEAFSALSKNGRPCFVNRGKYAYDIAEFSGNTSFGKNFAVYRTSKTNYYEIDFALRFYIGALTGNSKKKFKAFKKRLITCVENNPIALSDGTRFLKLKVPIVFSHYHKNKYQKYKLNAQYVDNNFDKDIFGINLHEKLKRNNIENYNIDIKCPVIIHELLHITGLHDFYTEKDKLTGKEKTTTIYAPTTNGSTIIELSKKHCLNYGHKLYREKLCKSVLISKKLIKIKDKLPLFDCRNPEDYKTTQNLMNNQNFFSLNNRPIRFNICQKSDSVGKRSKDIPIKEQKLCYEGDTFIISSTLSSVDKVKRLIPKYINNKIDKGEFKKANYYVTFYNRKNIKLPPSLTKEQFSSILYSNNLDHPEVREFARIAKNTYRNKYGKGAFGGCRR